MAVKDMAKNSTGRKRTDAQREADLVDVARMLLKGSEHGGVSTSDIREWLNSTRPYTLSSFTIKRDIEEVYARWRASQIRDVGVLKGRELSRIDAIEAEAWRAWFESGEDIQEETREEIRDAGENQGWSRDRVIKKVVVREPNPRYMNIIKWCVEQRCRILDLYPAEKLEIHDWREQALRAGFDPGELFNDMVGRFIEDSASVDGEGGE